MQYLQKLTSRKISMRKLKMSHLLTRKYLMKKRKEIDPIGIAETLRDLEIFLNQSMSSYPSSL
jgi:hypothetical protein